MVGRRADISSRHIKREEIRTTVDNIETANGIAHIARPILRHKTEHAEIKTVAATGTIFKENVWIFFHEAAK